MATDVDVQYFSHLNGLTLGNNWGDLIRLLDKALVTGIDFTQITAASIDAQGDVHITLYAAHNAMLFQVVELSGFSPVSLNQKYRIKGVPSATELILKPHTAIAETSITTVGAGKLASLGYDIIFRDANDVKRVYRAKNPTAQHPFIRVDESLTSPDGTTGVYTSSYAKYAMVGLLESMTHIDDFENPDVLQLPFDTTNPAKNWTISGTGTSVVRGWARWYWSRAGKPTAGNYIDSDGGNIASNFTIVGNTDCIYTAINTNQSAGNWKVLQGLGLYNKSLPSDVVPNWFLSAYLTSRDAASSSGVNFYNGYSNSMLTHNTSVSKFFAPKYNVLQKNSNHIEVDAILLNYNSGGYNTHKNQISALEIPFLDTDTYLRGTLPIVAWSGNLLSNTFTTPILSDSSMYIYDTLSTGGMSAFQQGGVYFYLGDIE